MNTVNSPTTSKLTRALVSFAKSPRKLTKEGEKFIPQAVASYMIPKKKLPQNVAPLSDRQLRDFYKKLYWNNLDLQEVKNPLMAYFFFTYKLGKGKYLWYLWIQRQV